MKIGSPGGCAPCVFQRLRPVGPGLDGELAQLVPPAGLTSAQTDAVIPTGTPLPSRSRSLKAEFRATARAPESRSYLLPFFFSLPSLPPNCRTNSTFKSHWMAHSCAPRADIRGSSTIPPPVAHRINPIVRHFGRHHPTSFPLLVPVHFRDLYKQNTPLFVRTGPPFGPAHAPL